MDAANMLKPLLARGELRVIGATTLAEFRRIERDGALARRFSPVTVDEPSVDDTIAILRGLREPYEAHHDATITDEALAAAARLSDRYVTARAPARQGDRPRRPGRRQGAPGRARDRRRARRAARRARAPRGREARRRRGGGLRGRGRDQGAHRGADRAAGAASAPRPRRRRGPSSASARSPRSSPRAPGSRWASSSRASSSACRSSRPTCTAASSARSRPSRPSPRPSAAPASGWPRRTSRWGPSCSWARPASARPSSSRPWPSGCSPRSRALVRIDMSEFREPHTVARLIGSPPGYVGYGDGGQLTEPVRRRPYSVVLLDEVEKAHPEVWNVLLQLLDDGRLTDGEGRTVDFTNTVVVMTSNLGAGQAKRALGFTAAEAAPDDERMLAAAKAAFLPEFLNRIDEVVTFARAGRRRRSSGSARMVVGRVADRLRAERGDRARGRRRARRPAGPGRLRRGLRRPTAAAPRAPHAGARADAGDPRRPPGRRGPRPGRRWGPTAR